MQLTTVSSVARPAPAVDQRQLGWLMLALAALFALLPTAGFAADAPPPKLDSGDTAWMLTSTALVLMMTIPGLALFYGGMVRQQNVLALLMQDRQSVGEGKSVAVRVDLGGRRIIKKQKNKIKEL